ncbi:UPF0287-domain-containing protein [Pseudovirgaria hyperparasitica]|uniref:COX assembly mitochondrial protein n=1 Tax=Pseudovirgaria hyperparasitica TaxID=470096 RepID=A0A6A6VWM8_9PEZI|nr:UPF0287-domain-containing protein [Pseudovirgaria hyperparasitica]KAF2754259.1 UPF0287-domain-containing protein [Pseudovirgaria hyperparasitica]
MHPHLHTKDNTNCADVMNALEECHARGFLYRCTGACTDAKIAVNKCLRGERLERQRLNREKAKIINDKKKQAFNEIKENS